MIFLIFEFWISMYWSLLANSITDGAFAWDEDGEPTFASNTSAFKILPFGPVPYIWERFTPF